MNQNYNQLKVGAEGLLHENEDLKSKLKKKERWIAFRIWGLLPRVTQLSVNILLWMSTVNVPSRQRAQEPGQNDPSLPSDKFLANETKPNCLWQWNVDK